MSWIFAEDIRRHAESVNLSVQDDTSAVALVGSVYQGARVSQEAVPFRAAWKMNSNSDQWKEYQRWLVTGSVYESLHETALGINTLQTHIVRLLSERPKAPATDRSQQLERLDWEMSWTGLLPLGEQAGPENSVLKSQVGENRDKRAR